MTLWASSATVCIAAVQCSTVRLYFCVLCCAWCFVMQEVDQYQVCPNQYVSGTESSRPHLWAKYAGWSWSRQSTSRDLDVKIRYNFVPYKRQQSTPILVKSGCQSLSQLIVWLEHSYPELVSHSELCELRCEIWASDDPRLLSACMWLICSHAADCHQHAFGTILRFFVLYSIYIYIYII